MCRLDESVRASLLRNFGFASGSNTAPLVKRRFFCEAFCKQGSLREYLLSQAGAEFDVVYWRQHDAADGGACAGFDVLTNT
jgi:hypothetical protein